MRIILAWLPFAVLWTLFMLTFTEGGVAIALLSGFVNTGVAALLGLAVWHLTKFYTWPNRLRVSFYATHLAVGVGYASIWAASSMVGSRIILGLPFKEYLAEPSLIFWRVMMGLWIYGCVTGVCYAIRNFRRLEEQKLRALQAEGLATKAALRSLRARLHPHFLYNALHSISALLPEEAMDAEGAIERLGDLLRYVLEEREERFVPLAEEWKFTLDYLELENLRVENAVMIVTDLDDQASGFQIPPLILQPLVENAMKHGDLADRLDAYIKISAELNDDRLMLVVEDNGSGAGTSGNGHASGQGLPILIERLQRLYDGKAEVIIEDRGQNGFRVGVAIPRPVEDIREKQSVPAHNKCLLAVDAG